MDLKAFLILLSFGLTIVPSVEAKQERMKVKVKLVRCSKTSGGMYREGPPELPLCSPIGSRFSILGDCKNKYDARSCKFVQKKSSKNGFSEPKLSPGIYHFVWDSQSPELRIQTPCSGQVDDAYDVEIQKHGQEVRLVFNEHCAAP